MMRIFLTRLSNVLSRNGSSARLVAVLLIAYLALPVAAPGQAELTPTDGIQGDLHRAHIGRITFMAAPIRLADFNESHFLTSFEVKDPCDLNIRVFLATSLTNALARLAPGMPPEEIARIGNYQFSFFVDDALAYRENLHPGAGSAESKHARTILRVPLISTTGEDSWGRFLWSRFMMNGGEDALDEGPHVLRIEMRPYLGTPDIRVGDVMARGELRLSVKRPAVAARQIAVQPIRSGSGWPIARGDYDTTAIRNLNRKIANGTFKSVTSLVVIRKGRLLLEEYFNGETRSSRHDTRSVGKTFASALAGLAIGDGYLRSEDQTLSEFYDLSGYANPSPSKARVTLKHLLTMTSVFDGSDANEDSPGNEEKMYPTDNWVRFSLDLPVDESRIPGGQWSYFTAGVVLLGDILHRAVPGGLERYAHAKLFSPLGIRDYTWQYTPQHVANTAGGLRMRSLDLAKFGQLYANGGRWNRRQIIPRAWVERSTLPHVSRPDEPNGGYGYLWWNTSFEVNGKREPACVASGNGGNKIVVFRNKPLVVVVTAQAFNTPYQHVQVQRMLEKHLLPAVWR